MKKGARSGHLIYATREGTLFAVPFDVDRLEVTGAPRGILDGLQVDATGGSFLALSETGDLVDRRGASGKDAHETDVAAKPRERLVLPLAARPTDVSAWPACRLRSAESPSPRHTLP